MKKEVDRRAASIPPMWLVLTVTGIGIYGTGTAYRWLTGAGPAGDGLTGLGAMLLAVLILGTPLARAWELRRRLRHERAKRLTHLN